MNYCFISGDSFEEDNLTWSPSAGQLISEHHDLKWDTYAKGGQGNFYIFNSIINNIKNKDYKLALISWSSVNRKDHITNFSNWQVSGYSDVMKIQDTHVSLADQIIFESLNYIAAAQLIFESLKIPYCMWWSINNIDDTKNKKCHELMEQIKSKNTFYNFDSSSFEYAKNINHLSTYDNAHPDQEAHRKWSLKVLDYMEQEGIKVF